MKNIIFLLSFLFTFNAQGINWEKELNKQFEKQRYEFPQEKVYVNTDRSNYMGGDTIWMRAYVTDASSHIPVNASKYLYVELKAPSDSVLTRVKIKESNGIYAGYVALPMSPIEADYTLIAYTAFMDGLGEDYFFKKTLRIGNPISTKHEISTAYTYDSENDKLTVKINYTDKLTKKPATVKNIICITPDGEKTAYRSTGNVSVSINHAKEKTGKHIYVAFDNYRKFLRIPEIDNDYDVTFHPEGGWLIANHSNKVALKAINSSGTGEFVTGKIIDDTGNEVVVFETKHSGMAHFSFTPSAGRLYKAVCQNEDGTEKIFILPKPETEATVLNVIQDNDSVHISSYGKSLKGYLIVHEKGNLLYSSEISTGCTSGIKKTELPTGIINAVLFDSQWNPLSERLFFVGNGMPEIGITSDKRIYGKREEIKLTVSAGNLSGKADFSIAVTDNHIIPVDSACSIVSSLLLSSEIKGGVENAEYYFNPDNPDTESALDALLMTQGWRRYDIPAVAKGNIDYPKSAIEIGQEISGVIKTKWMDKPESFGMVSLFVPQFGFADIFKADENGKFVCNGFDFPENTKIMIQEHDKTGKIIYPNIRFDNFKYPKTTYKASGISDKQTENRWRNYVEQEATRYKYNGMSVTLDEIIVTGLKIKTPEDAYEASAFRSFGYKQIENESITSIEELLRKIPGLLQTPEGNYEFRGQPATLYVDGFEQTGSTGGGSEYEDFYRDTQAGSSFARQARKSREIQNKAHTAPAFNYPDGGTSIVEQMERIPMDFVKRVDFIRPSEAVMLGSAATSGGAIMITTKRGEEVKGTDYENFVSIVPLGYQKKAEFYSPKYETEEERNSTVTDMRPTLYWNPSITVDKNGKTEISFYSSDISNTSYTLRIEGITDKGEPFKKDHTISIR